MALLSVQVPEDGRSRSRRQGQTHFGRPGDQLLVRRSDLGNARKVPLHIGAEDRHPGVREALSHDLKGDRLAGASGAGDHAVSVGAVKQQGFRLGGVGLAEE